MSSYRKSSKVNKSSKVKGPFIDKGIPSILNDRTFPFGKSGSSQTSPLGNGFGNVDPLGSNGVADNANVSIKDGLGRTLGSLGGANSAMQGGNFMDFLTGLVGSGKVTAEVASMILQSVTQYGMAVDQRQYDYLLTQDQRKYDWNLLQDSRTYSSPTNELARLMGAGISRDAAIQLLSSSGSGAGLGSGSPVTSSVPTVAGMDTPGTQELNTFNSAVSAITSLVGLGFSIPQAVQQYNYLKGQNYLSSQQIQAYDASSAAYTVLSNIGANSESYGSIESVVSTINDAAKNGNLVASEFVRNGGANKLYQTAPYSAPIIADMYKRNRESQDYASTMNRLAEMHDAEIELRSVTSDKIRQETVNLNEEFHNIQSDTAYKDAMRAVAEKQKEVLESTKLNIDQDTKVKIQQEWVQYYTWQGIQDSNDENYGYLNAYADGKSGSDWLNDSKLQEIIRFAKTNAGLNDTEHINKLIERQMLDAEAAAGVLSLMIWKHQATAKELNDNPSYAAAAAAVELVYKPYFESLIGNKEEYHTLFGWRSHSKSPTVFELTKPRD